MMPILPILDALENNSMHRDISALFEWAVAAIDEKGTLLAFDIREHNYPIENIDSEI